MYMYLPHVNIYCLSCEVLSFKVFKNVFERGVITHCNKRFNKFEKKNYESICVLTSIKKLLLLIKGFHRHD